MKTPEKNFKFEKALERLEVIVSELESGDLSLDDTLKRYEEGVKLSRLCHGQLSDTEKKVELLLAQRDEISGSSPGKRKKQS